MRASVPPAVKDLRCAVWLLLIFGNNTGAQAGPRHEILAAHNSVRAKVGVPPLVWSDAMAERARHWANTLLARGEFAHSPKSPFGENLYEIRGAFASPGEVVKAWADESAGYDYRRNQCSGVCGHYTQIIWADTKEVGCASARSRNREVWVCNYNPPGNWIGRRPY
jgi:uncharacterized protein YkwD